MTEKRKSIENQTNQKPIIMETQTTNVQRSCTPPLKTTEEEIDRAFEIIEKIQGGLTVRIIFSYVMVVLVLVWYDLCVVDNVSYVVGIVVYNNDVGTYRFDLSKQM